MKMKKRATGWVLGSLVFFVTRLWVLNRSDVWFDSPEYIRRISDPSLWHALIDGHVPLHAGYVLFGWPIEKLFGMSGVVVGQIGLGFLGLVALYQVVNVLFDKKTARLSVILFSLLPIVWVSQTTIMMESVYVPMFFLGWWLTLRSDDKNDGCFLFELVKNLSRNLHLNFSTAWKTRLARRRKKARLVRCAEKTFQPTPLVGLLFLAWAFLAHTVILLWLPLVIWSVWKVQSKNLPEILTGLTTGLGLAVVINGWLIAEATDASLVSGVRQLFFAKLSDKADLGFDLVSIGRMVRNVAVPIYVHMGILTTLMSVYGLIRFAIPAKLSLALVKTVTNKSYLGFRKKQEVLKILDKTTCCLYRNDVKTLVTIFLWLFSILIVAQWWDFFSGRHLLIGFAGLSVVVAMVVKEKVWMQVGLVVYLLVMSLPAVFLLRSPTPYQLLRNEVKKLPKDSLVIASHFAKPHYKIIDGVNFMFVNQVGVSGKEIKEDVEQALKEERWVLVTSTALSEPYGQFSGPFVHPLGLSYRNEVILRKKFANLSVSKIKTIDAELVIYEVVGMDVGKSLQIKHLNKSSVV